MPSFFVTINLLLGTFTLQLTKKFTDEKNMKLYCGQNYRVMKYEIVFQSEINKFIN